MHARSGSHDAAAGERAEDNDLVCGEEVGLVPPAGRALARAEEVWSSVPTLLSPGPLHTLTNGPLHAAAGRRSCAAFAERRRCKCTAGGCLAMRGGPARWGQCSIRGQREWQSVQYIDSLAVPPLQTTDHCNIHVKTKERRAGMPPDKVGQWLAELALAPLREEWIPPCDRRSARSLVGVRKR